MNSKESWETLSFWTRSTSELNQTLNWMRLCGKTRCWCRTCRHKLTEVLNNLRHLRKMKRNAQLSLGDCAPTAAVARLVFWLHRRLGDGAADKRPERCDTANKQIRFADLVTSRRVTSAHHRENLNRKQATTQLFDDSGLKRGKKKRWNSNNPNGFFTCEAATD